MDAITFCDRTEIDAHGHRLQVAATWRDASGLHYVTEQPAGLYCGGCSSYQCQHVDAVLVNKCAESGATKGA